MAYENKNFGENRNNESIFSKRIKAGKRRTYFFDVRTTRGNDYFITITESKKRFDDNGYDRHKMFLYKEDFNKFIVALNETVDHVKTELMPDFDFDAFNHDQDEDGNYINNRNNNSESKNNTENTTTEPVVETTTTDAVEAKVDEVVETPVVATSSVIDSIDDNSSVEDWKI